MQVRKVFLIWLGTGLAVFWLALFLYLRNPILIHGIEADAQVQADPQSLERHVRALSELNPPRDHSHPESMLAAEAYILKELEANGYTVRLQDVPAGDHTFHNLIVRYEPDGLTPGKDLIVIGAHYDAADMSDSDDPKLLNPGADDNASGVAGLLELARLVKVNKPILPAPLEIVFYTLEEPPHFAGPKMGSAIHADALAAEGINVKYMVSLEMIGYFDSRLGSQQFPFPLLYTMYSSRGDSIAIISNPKGRKLTRALKRHMSANSDVPVVSINAPAALPGIDFSDHRSYWKHKWPAVMVTDTAFYRNHEYHRPGDTADRLNYANMAQVVRGVYGALAHTL